MHSLHACSAVSDSFATHGPCHGVPCQIPLSVGFPRQEYSSGLPFPPPGDLPNPGIKPESPASTALAGRFFITEPSRKPISVYIHIIYVSCVYK